jgi:hypothetical protein
LNFKFQILEVSPSNRVKTQTQPKPNNQKGYRKNSGLPV